MKSLFLLGLFVNAISFAQVWSSASTLVTENAGKILSPAVGTNATGQVVAAWSQNNTVQAMVRTGSVWSTPGSLSTAGQIATSTVVAVSPSGAAAVAWTEGAAGSTVVRVAFYSGGSWGPATTVSAPGNIAASPQIAYDSLDQATLAWFESVSTTCAIRSATGSSGTGWTVPTTVSTDCYSYLQLAVNGRGEAILSWGIRGPVVRGGSPVIAAFRTAGGIWGSPVLISSGTYRSSSPTVALGDKGGAIAVWGDPFGVYYSRRAADGSWSTPGYVDSLNYFAGTIAAAADMSGNIVATYTIVSYDAGGGAIYPAVARRLAANSFRWSNAAAITPPTATAGALKLSASPAGSFVALWTDSNTGNVGVSTLVPGTGWKRTKLGSGDNDVAVHADRGIGVALWNRYWTTPSTVLVSTTSLP